MIVKTPKHPNTQTPKLTVALTLLGIWVFGYLDLCHADLSAVVSPGYTFASGERADTSKLNRLGNPTITITGTVGGTNANVANNSINGAMLVNGLPGSNLTWDANSPRRLVLTNDGVTAYQLNSNAFGAGLKGGSSAQVTAYVDTNTITMSNNIIVLNLTTFSNLVNILATNVAQYQVTNAAPGASFGWAKFYGTNSSTTYSPLAGYNISNVVRTALGRYTVNLTNSMLTTNYAIQLQPMTASPGLIANIATQSTNAFTLTTWEADLEVYQDPEHLFLQILK